MPGVTEQEIAQAKQMNLYQYMQLCEPDNFKPEGPGQIPPQRAQLVDLCRGWFVDVLQNESYRPHRAELSHSG